MKYELFCLVYLFREGREEGERERDCNDKVEIRIGIKRKRRRRTDIS
jgi:hypothetical protein